MKVEATVDVGGNLTSLLERLAQQIGVTVDTIFPWYVQQAYLHGVTTLCTLGAAILLALIVFPMAVKRCDFVKGNVWAAISVFSGAALAVSLIATFIEGPRAVREMLNPQFYAMQVLVEDIGRMRGR